MADTLALIADRVSQEMHPAVLPMEQTALEVDVAAELVSWVQQVDVAEIQSYIEEQWDTFWRSNNFIADKPEALHRAAWSWARYYVYIYIYIYA